MIGVNQALFTNKMVAADMAARQQDPQGAQAMGALLKNALTTGQISGDDKNTEAILNYNPYNNVLWAGDATKDEKIEKLQNLQRLIQPFPNAGQNVENPENK